MNRTFLLLLFSIFLCSVNGFSQAGADFRIFKEEADQFSLLYRGTTPLVYKFLHTGTYYAYTEQYIEGSVVFNNKEYTGVLLNLNSHLDELYVSIPENNRKVMINKEFVSSFRIGERSFIKYKEAYYEVLYRDQSTQLLKKIGKSYAERINQAANISTNTKLERLFIGNDSYFILENGARREIKRKRDFASVYSVKRGDVRRVVREKNLDTKHNKDMAYYEIISFVKMEEREVK